MADDNKEEGTKNILASSSLKPFMSPPPPPPPSSLIIITTIIQLITSPSLLYLSSTQVDTSNHGHNSPV
ncbi:hypothetical protein E2C01_084515 [Portunus trituberculatus]|uniref:Transmembrane protein n=1 Tax=Portunus trituberculatus TaxID=210409 RepID=A0A5B7J076_PORTR|nr:hypothetical protein [Portunus trituberculatus]